MADLTPWVGGASAIAGVGVSGLFAINEVRRTRRADRCEKLREQREKTYAGYLEASEYFKDAVLTTGPSSQGQSRRDWLVKIRRDQPHVIPRYDVALSNIRLLVRYDTIRELVEQFHSYMKAASEQLRLEENRRAFNDWSQHLDPLREAMHSDLERTELVANRRAFLRPRP
jgi:hypothetical protein